MPRSFAAITGKPATALAACALLFATQTSAADELGIANYASYQDRGYALEAAAMIEERLGNNVQIAEIDIDGNAWLRLQSGSVDVVEAKSLVVRATAAGYPAWYQSAATNHSVITTTSKTTTTKASTESDAPSSATSSTGFHNADPKLVAMLPEGPLLGEIYPPRSPIQDLSAN